MNHTKSQYYNFGVIWTVLIYTVDWVNTTAFHLFHITSGTGKLVKMKSKILLLLFFFLISTAKTKSGNGFKYENEYGVYENIYFL